jgi:C-terminal processing protease CtpA/Prc
MKNALRTALVPAMVFLLACDLRAAETAKSTRSAGAEPGWLGLGFVCHVKRTSAANACDALVVVALAPNGPAARRGLKEHDILVEINGKPARFGSHRDALKAFRAFRAGQIVRLRILRDQKITDMRLTAVSVPPEFANQWRQNDEMARENDALAARSKQD